METGQYITDGDVTWIVTDIRDNAMVGDIVLSPVLRKGYVKANGATLLASDYPRLVQFAVDNRLVVTASEYSSDCSKYVYDESQGTLVIPNAVGRVLQGGNSTRSVEAGLPNIEGVTNFHSLSDMIPMPNCFYNTDTTTTQAWSTTSVSRKLALAFDASRSNAIYGNSTTVQPPALQLVAQIKY